MEKFEKTLKKIKKEMDNGYNKGVLCAVLDYRRKNPFVKKKNLKRFRPGKISNNLFWKKVHENFGNLTITNDAEKITIEDVNKGTLKMAKGLGVLGIVDSNIKKSTKILEIGSGYGNFHNWLESKSFNMDNYYSIDVYSYFYHENLFITDGNSFPKDLPKFDIIYCLNVFQHLTQKQRNMYYNNIYKHLNEDGLFIGGNIMKHPENKDKPFWKIKDKKGNDYVSFFGQYTEVEDSFYFYDKLKEIGFSKIKFISMGGNYLSYKIKK